DVRAHRPRVLCRDCCRGSFPRESRPRTAAAPVEAPGQRRQDVQRQQDDKEREPFRRSGCHLPPGAKSGKTARETNATKRGGRIPPPLLFTASMAAAALALGPAASAQQESKPASPSKPAPRTHGGKPDFSGVWDHPYVPDMTKSGRNQKGLAD